MRLGGGTSDGIDGIRILSNVCKIGKDFNSIAGNEGTEDIFQKWDQTPDFGLKSLILVSFYF